MKASQDSYKWIGEFLIIAMIMVYPISLFFIDLLLDRELKYFDVNMLFYGLSASAAIIISPKKIPSIKLFQFKSSSFVDNFLSEKSINIFKFLALFSICLIIFSAFPWHEERSSLGASFAGIFRALWLIYGISFLNKTEIFKFLYLASTIILAFIDESRTYFFIALAIVASCSRFKALYFSLGISLLLILAAVRLDGDQNLFFSLILGVTGETINATHAYRQLDEVIFNNYQTTGHLLHIMISGPLSPIIIFLEKLSLAGYLPFLSSNYILGTAVSGALYETLNPMGGWYIANDMILYGVFGNLIIFSLVFINFNITKMLLNGSFPLGTYLFILFPKTNILIFYNMVFYLIFFMLLMFLLNKLRFKW